MKLEMIVNLTTVAEVGRIKMFKMSQNANKSDQRPFFDRLRMDQRKDGIKDHTQIWGLTNRMVEGVIH